MATRYILRRTDHTILCDGEGMLASQVVVHLNAMAQQVTALQVANAKLTKACERIMQETHRDCIDESEWSEGEKMAFAAIAKATRS